MERFDFLSTLKFIYDQNKLNLTEYQNEIQDIKDQKAILKIRKAELPISVDFENQISRAENFSTSTTSEVVSSKLKAEYDLSIWNERLRKKVIETDISILESNIILKEQDEKYNIFKLLLDIVYTNSLIKIYEDRTILMLRNIENFSLDKLGENTIKKNSNLGKNF